MQQAVWSRPLRSLGTVEPQRPRAVRATFSRVARGGAVPTRAIHVPGNGKVQPEAFGRDDEDVLVHLISLGREGPSGPSDCCAETARQSEPGMSSDIEDDSAKEKFWGRVAVLALGAVLLAERLTGNGAVQAMDLSTGIPLWEIEPFLGLLVVGLLVAAFFPCRNERSRMMRDAKIAHVRAKNFGKVVIDRVQNWSGRLACFGLASSIVAEVATGKGALALLNIETGVETISEVEAGIAFLVMLLLTEDLKRPSV